MLEKLRELIIRHCETLNHSVAELALCLRPTDGSTPDPRTLERAKVLVHQMKGSGGSMGFPDISSAAAELEAELEALMAANGAFPPEIGPDLTTSLATLERVVQQLAPEQSRLFNLDMEKLVGRTGRRTA